MAKIIWHEQALQELASHLDYASIEFGRTTVLRWKQEIVDFEENVRKYPNSYTPEQLLLNKPVLYRRRHLMKQRFKLIYYYEESEDTVHVVDIWDTRMSPKALVLRITGTGF